MSFNVYHNPTNVKLGDIPIKDVQSIVVSCRYHESHAAGDGDTRESVARLTVARTSGIIALLAEKDADAIQARSGTLSFTWTTPLGSEKVVTLRDSSIGGLEDGEVRGVNVPVVLPFIAESAPDIS